MNIISTLFDWPNGIVVGNLIASVICVGVAAFHIERLAKRHHKEHMAFLHRIHRSVTMPYKVIGPNGEGKFDIINEESGAVKATKDTKEDAERQVRLLHEVEKHPEWEANNGNV